MTVNIVSPQGFTVSTLLYISHNDNYRSYHDNNHILKFVDDTVVVKLVTCDENKRGRLVKDFLKRFHEVYLDLNT